MSVLPRARRPDRGRGESGQTLYELIAVVFLLSIVLVVVFEGVDSTARVLSGTERRLTNLGEARTLMAVATKDLRTATRLQAGTSPFVLADQREVTFYANLNNPTSGPRKVHIYVDSAKQLIESVQVPDSGSVAPNYTYTGAAALRFVGRYVNNASSVPIFVYYDNAGTPLAAPLSSTDRLAVYSVKISLSIRKQTTLPVADTTLVNQVRLPNVDYQQVTG